MLRNILSCYLDLDCLPHLCVMGIADNISVSEFQVLMETEIVKADEPPELTNHSPKDAYPEG